LAVKILYLTPLPLKNEDAVPFILPVWTLLCLCLPILLKVVIGLGQLIGYGL